VGAVPVSAAFGQPGRHQPPARPPTRQPLGGERDVFWLVGGSFGGGPPLPVARRLP
jgi:hypothetical protein